ncbi:MULTISPECIES: macro domain-containing protein [unclassified Aureispira]|uniref:macro domain-containing protein n=1 Tax=unclassified Aureispira TaxID=2649989 RepID=UPI000695AC27|nr:MULTISPECIES: macro domain-containing protein [unclassified Aureispira]WMX14432.1 macro domain-containing protein [Aureispira sp. CCB-E]
MKTITGDLIQLALEGVFEVIVHGCNCYGTMGAGIAKGIKKHFPEAYEADLKTEKGAKDKLGTFSFANIEDKNLIVVNAYTQYHWRGTGRKVDYEAVRAVFKQIKKQFEGKKIAYPAIGAGLAGGDWNIIATIIREELEGEDHTFVLYQA